MLQYQEQRLMGGEKFHVKRGELTFSVPSVELTLSPGEVKEDSFTILGDDGRAAAGFVVSSQPPMKVLTGMFSGAKEVIAYSFDAAGFAPGEELAGEFTVLSDRGEAVLPFHVAIRGCALDSAIGPVRSLLHFVNLARSNWREAVRVFYQPAFASVLETEGDPRICALYRGLSARPGNEHNVEEFLISAGKKQPAEYSAEPGEISLELAAGDRQPVQGQIRIRRSGWGLAALTVSFSGAFLAGPAGRPDPSCWKDGVCLLPVTVDPSRVHAGRNYGRIVLSPDWGDPIEIPVTVSWNACTALQLLRRKEYHRVILEMMQEFIDFRLRLRSAQEMSERMDLLIRRLQECDRNNPFTAMYRIHYLVTVRREQDALWELQALNRRLFGLDGPMPAFSVAQFDLEDDVAYAYRMYLTILCAEAMPEQAGSTGVVNEAVRAIEERRRRNPGNFWITWVLLYADAELAKRPSRMLSLLREQYDRGARSPILYMEVWQMVRLSPTLLGELGDFELQVLLFAAKRGVLTDSVMTRVNDLARRRKTFSKRLLRILTAAYGPAAAKDPGKNHGENHSQDPMDPAKHPAADAPGGSFAQSGAADAWTGTLSGSSAGDVPEAAAQEAAPLSGVRRDTLESICTLLIRGNMTDPSCSIWYRRGIEQGLGITRLFDYYMLSLPAGYEGDLPQIVLLYYSYQNSLPAAQTACLYRYLVLHRREQEDLYAQYAQRIDEFTLSQMTQRRISQDLAVLYREYLASGRPLDERTAAAAVELLHTRRFRLTRPVTGRAVVIYPHFLSEQYCPVGPDGALAAVYGSSALILFEDAEGNRYAASSPCSCETMMDPETPAPQLRQVQIDNFLYDLAQSESLTQGGSCEAAGNAAGDSLQQDPPGRPSASVLPPAAAQTGVSADPGASDALPAGQSAEVTADSAPRLLRLVMDPQVTPSHRAKLRAALLSYYEAQGDAAGLVDLLTKTQPGGLGSKERAELLRLMTQQGLWRQAFDWITRFGTEGVDGAALLRLASGLLREAAPVDQEVLAQIAWSSFRAGFYDESVLRFLAQTADAETARLEEVREAAADYGLDEYDLSRRMLTQMLFTGEVIPEQAQLLSCCRRHAADVEFLTDVLGQMSHCYYIDGRPMSEEAIAMIGGCGMDGTPLLDICRIAWLKDRSERSGETDPRDLEITELFLSDLVGRGVVLPFFRQFAGVLPALQESADETLFEYRAARPAPGAKILFHYAVERDGVRERYAVRRMKEMYEGVYVTGFLLFFGEQLHYYITDDPQEKNIVLSGTLGQDARIASSGNDRFGAINQIAMLTALGRDEEALALMEDYERRSWTVERLFGE